MLHENLFLACEFSADGRLEVNTYALGRIYTEKSLRLAWTGELLVTDD